MNTYSTIIVQYYFKLSWIDFSEYCTCVLLMLVWLVVSELLYVCLVGAFFVNWSSIALEVYTLEGGQTGGLRISQLERTNKIPAEKCWKWGISAFTSAKLFQLLDSNAQSNFPDLRNNAIYFFNQIVLLCCSKRVSIPTFQQICADLNEPASHHCWATFTLHPFPSL